MPAFASAHSLLFGVLRVVEDADGATLTLRAGGAEGQPPPLSLDVSGACALEGPPAREIVGGLLVLRARASCLEGARVTVEGLGAAGMRVAVQVVRQHGGEEAVAFLEPTSPSVVLGARTETPAVFPRYAMLGVEHLAFGLDHLLFLLALVLVVFDPRVRRPAPMRTLALTISGFTAGHAVTLSLAVLGGVTLPSAPVEACIALSIVFLAAELVRAPTHAVFRAPWAVAAAFGLLHGLGFAGALAELGLPASDAPVALVAFHVGLEVAQLGFVALAVLALSAAKRLRRPSPALAWSIGAVAAVWVGLRFAPF
ncbi:MAG: HupE/UreJ family protein [Sandaracinaceae bacterium]